MYNAFILSKAIKSNVIYFYVSIFVLVDTYCITVKYL